MPESTKYMFPGGLNRDAAEYSYPHGDNFALVNVRALTSDIGKAGSATLPYSNRLVSASQTILSGISGNFTCIGWFEQYDKQRVFYFLYNDVGNHVVCMLDNQAGSISIVLDNRTFLQSGLNKGLDFSLSNLITGIWMIGDTLYWTDNKNDVRRYSVVNPVVTSQFIDSYISLIRRPPAYPMSAAKAIGANLGITVTNNMIATNAFQFSYRYTYINGEQSVLAPYSNLCNYNLPSDSWNCIQVKIPFSEHVPDDYQSVDIVVEIKNGDVSANKFYLIKSFTRISDSAAIAAHNAGTTQLSYIFLNNQVGLSLDPAYAAKTYDTIPLSCQSLECAKNRVFLGNYTEGYNTPQISSLSAVVTNGSTSVVTGNWCYLQFDSSCNPGVTNSYYLLDISNVPNPGYYYLSTFTGPPYPSSVDFNTLQYAGAGLFDAMNFLDPGCTHTIVSFQNGLGSSTITNVAPPSSIGQVVYKANGAFQVGVQFYDQYLRPYGVTPNGPMVSIPDRTYTQTSYPQFISWALNNTNALTEIPEGAAYYSILRTKNLQYISFVQAISSSVQYYSVDAQGNYTYHNGPYDGNYTGVAIDIGVLSSYGIGYVFQSTDFCRVYPSTSSGLEQNMKVVGLTGATLLCSLANIGDTSSTNLTFLFEIYTPYLASTNEPYYEVGQVYPVLNAGTNNRQYSVLSGNLVGDITLITRGSSTQYEVMSPYDGYWQYWNTPIGRPSAVLPQPSQLSDIVGIRWSDQLIPNTNVNGTSSFYGTSQVDLPTEMGAIQILKLTRKVQEEGTVMLAVGQMETSSIYLGEAQIYSPDGNATLSTTQGVIGTVNVLLGGFGTLHPESFQSEDGHAWWYCITLGTVIRYAQDGLTPIGDVKMRTFFTQRSNDLLSLMRQGQTVRVFSFYDRFNDEYGLFLPSSHSQPASVVQDVTPNSFTFTL